MAIASKHLDKLIAGAIRKKFWPQNFLLIGSDREGKLQAARRAAATILGDMERIEQGIHPDCCEVAPQGVLAIHSAARMRSLVAQEKLCPYSSSFRVVIIIDAERTESSQMLLKTLEEAKQTIYFLLACGEEKMLPTVRSRAWAVSFPPPAKGVGKVDVMEQAMTKLLAGNWQSAEVLDEATQQAVEREQLIDSFLHCLLSKMQEEVYEKRISLSQWREIVVASQKGKIAFQRSMRGVWEALFIDIFSILQKT